MEEKKEISIEEMQAECLKIAFEIAKMESIHKKLIKKFDDLNYKIWKLQKEKENAPETTSKDSK